MTRLDIPVTAPFTLATMQHTHARVEVTPNDDRSLSYDLALPKYWAYSKEFGPVEEGLLQARGLGFFASSLEPGAPVVAVTVTTIPFEVPADTWIRLAFERSGWEVVAGQWFPGPNGLFFDVTGVLQNSETELVRRTSVRVDGTNLFCVNTMCARERWDRIKEDFWTAHVTFALLGASGSTRMEALLRASTLSPSFETVHPRSWFSEAAESASAETSGVHIRLADAERETLLAYLLIRAERRSKDDSGAENLGDTLTMLQKSGVLLAAGALRPQSQDDDPRSLAATGWIAGYVGEGVLRDSEIAIRIGFIERANVLFTMVLYSPRLKDDLLTALRAQRAFEIARAGLTLLP